PENTRESFEAAAIVNQAGPSRFWFACAFGSGFVSTLAQLNWSRVLAMIIGSSTYAFTIVLALFLIGLSLGSWIVSAKAGSNPIRLRRSIMFVQLATAVSILVSLRITNSIPSLLIQIAFRLGVNSWAALLALHRALARSLSIGIIALLIILAFAGWPRLNVNALSIGAYDSFVRVLARSRGDVPENNENDRSGDHELLMFQEGRTATVSVRRDWGITSVAINGRTNASDADDMPTQVMLGQLGVLTAPRLSNALIVGFATGVTTGSVLQSPIESVECVEI